MATGGEGVAAQAAQTVRRGIGRFFTLGIIAVGIAIAVGIIWGGVAIVNNLPGTEGNPGNPANLPGFLEGLFGVILGTGTNVTWEELSIHLAVFMILFIAITDMVLGFSSFGEMTAWVIGFGLALVAGATKMIGVIAGIFGVAAGFGALGVGIIVVAAILAAVVLNLGVGGPLKKWRTGRQIDIDTFNAERGFAKISSFMAGAADAADVANVKGRATNTRTTAT